MAGTGIFIGAFGLIFYLFILLLPIALLVALQAWLCKRSLKLGLILPCISLGLSLVMVLSLAAFSTLTVEAGNTPVTAIEGGAVQVPAQEEDYVQIPAQEGAPVGETEFSINTLMTVGVLFLVMNIPTAVFGGIWLHCKGRRDTLNDLKRMKIEDLG